MPTIRQRSKMILRAASKATGVKVQDIMVGNNEAMQQKARKVAIELYQDNLGFMGNNWIADQLGYGGSRRNFYYLDSNRLDLAVYLKAQSLYDRMLERAKK